MQARFHGCHIGMVGVDGLQAVGHGSHAGEVTAAPGHLESMCVCKGGFV